jgi:putative FmdB family regulatory protein
LPHLSVAATIPTAQIADEAPCPGGTMPTYEYACQDCGEHLEVVQSFKEEPLTMCGACGGRLRKVFSAAGIIFKGSGYYVTDSRAKKSGASKPGDKSDAKPGEKSDAKAETKADAPKSETKSSDTTPKAESA